MKSFSRLTGISILFVVLTLNLFTLSAYAWDTRSKITSVENANGETVLTINVDFGDMTSRPDASHHPTSFEVRTSTDGKNWTPRAAVPITTIPPSQFFDLTYILGKLTVTTMVQARVDCSIHGLSEWSPSTPFAIAKETTSTTTSTTTTSTTSPTTTSTSTSTSSTTTTSQTTTSSSTTVSSSTSSSTTSSASETVTGGYAPSYELYVIGIVVIIVVAAVGFMMYRRSKAPATSK